MNLKQCEAVVLHGRSPSGGSAGLCAPRRCRRVAVEGEHYCEVHQGQAELQDLFVKRLLVPGWEHRVESWERDREQAQARAARGR